MGIPPLSFTGFSDFSASFQTLLERTFEVASLPVASLQTEQTVLQSRQLELGNLEDDLNTLRATFDSIGVSVAQGAIQVSSSDTAVATVTRTGAPEPVNFDIVVTSAAAVAQETSLTGLGDVDSTALSNDGIYKLTLGSTTTTLDLAAAGFDNTLAGLRDALNEGGLGVSASIVNLSDDPDAPNYRLLITADQTGATTLKLQDSGDQDLLTASNQGSDAVFTVNGVSVTNSGNTIADFAPGISLTIQGAGQTKLKAANDVSGLSGRLADFATRYNAVVARLGAQIGKDAGVLSGDILIRQTQAALRAITGYSGSGSISSIAALGLTLDDQGRMSFDAATFSSVAAADFDAVKEFLGSTTSGLSGLARSRLNALADPVQGQIQTAIRFIQESDASISAQIDRLQERIDRRIEQLEAQFAAADALLARLEAQQDLLTQIFEANDRNRDR